MKSFFLTLLLVAAQFIANGQTLDHVQGELLVQLKYGQDIRPVLRQLETFNGKPTELQVVKQSSVPLRIWLLDFDWTSIEERSFLARLQSLQAVELAQFNHFISLRETVPEDPIFADQWQWVNTGQGGGTPDADVDADQAWDITTGGTTASGHEIVVCVVEGTNRNHPDLQGNLWVNTAETPGNGIDDDNNGYVDDYNGWNITNDSDQIPSESHGTQVAGMIGAKGNNSLFATGINWDVKIMNVEFNQITEANVVEAYTYPLIQRRRFNQSGGTEGAFVVATNSSWGIDGGNPTNSPLWCAFYDSLGVEGILSCGATANNNVNVDIVGDLPTACSSEYMVAVTASNNKDVRTFSGYGTTHIDVAAPGGGIVTLSQNGGPSNTSGTSFASPLTAGIIALLYSAPCSNISDLALADPSAAAMAIRDALFAGVDIKPNLLNETKYGGRVNAFNSLNILLANCGPCPKPYSISVTNIIDVSVDINWQSPDSSLLTKLRYRTIGDTTWMLLDSVTSPFTLAGLQACTGYEFQVGEYCVNDTSGFSNSFLFETDGCCVAPANTSLTELTTESALFAWDAVFAANSYNVLLTSTFGDSMVINLSTNSFAMTDLMPCTGYTVQVQTVCDTGATDFSIPINFTTLGCGACQDFVYCPSTADNSSSEWIENVNIGFINNTSGNNGGYGDFTASSMSTELLTYTTNPITLTPGFAGGTFPEWFVVYIDFNQDGDFSDNNEKVFDAGATSTTAVTGNIEVPGDALTGSTRMRVVMRWNTAPASSCAASFNYGEVEDYCISINPGTAPNCVAPTNLAVSDTTMTSAYLTWTDVPDANGYNIQYRRVGITGWTSRTSEDNALQINQLEPCKTYEVHVRASCLGINSDYSGSIFFNTLCINPTNEQLAQRLDLSVSPNPFSDEITVSFQLSNLEETSLEISDVWGRVAFQSQQLLPSGEHKLVFSPNLTAGVYFVKLKIGTGEVTKRVVQL